MEESVIQHSLAAAFLLSTMEHITLIARRVELPIHVNVNGNVEDIGVVVEGSLAAIPCEELAKYQTLSFIFQTMMNVPIITRCQFHSRSVVANNIPIDDQDLPALGTQFSVALTYPRCNTDVVEKTKSHGLRGFGVVTRRSDDGDRVLHLPRQHRPAGFDGCSGR